MATVEELLVRIDSTTEGLRREMRRAETTVDRSGRSIDRSVQRVDRTMERLNRTAQLASRALGAFGVGLSIRSVQNFATSALDAAESIADLNQRTGVATSTIQGFRQAADQSGSSASAADDALSRLSRRMGLFASREGGAAADAFRRLGISVETSGGQMRATEEVFRDVADAIGETSSEAQAAALASEFFGETAGPQLAASLRDGAAGIDEMIVRLRESGRLFDEEMIRKSAEASAGLRDLRNAATQTIQVGFLDQLSDSLGDTRDIATDPAFQGGLEAIGRILGFIATEALRGAENVMRLVDALQNLDPRSALDALIDLDPITGTGRRVGDALRDRLGLSQTDLEAAQAELERQRQQMQDLVTTRAQMERALETGVDARGNPVTGLRREGMAGNLENREREIAALREQMAAQRELVQSLRETEDAADDLIGQPGGSDGDGGSGLSGVGGSAGGAAVDVAALTQELQFQNEIQRQLNDALMRGAEEHRALTETVELENAAQEAGIDLSRRAGQAWARQYREGQRLTRENENIASAQDRIASAVDATRTPLERYQQTVAQIQADRPFARTAEDVEALERALSDARREVDPLYDDLMSLSSDIESAFTNAFQSMFERGADFGQVFADEMRRIVGSLVASFARQQIVLPIVAQMTGQGQGGLGQISQQLMGGTSLGGLPNIGGLGGLGGIASGIDSFGANLGFAAPSAHWAGGVTPGLFGTTQTLSGALGAAGMGAGIGSIASGLTGGNQLGGTIGGGIGGAIGSIFGPIGTVAGSAIGGGLGGLFGPGPSSNASGRTFDVASGQLLGSAGGGGQNAEIAQQIAQATTDFNQQLSQALGVDPVQRQMGITAADDMIEFWHHRGRGGDVEGAIKAAQRQIIDWMPGLSSAMRDALGRAFDRGTLDESLAFLQQYNEGFFDLGETMTQGEAQMAALQDRYDDAIRGARELGLSTREITRDFNALTRQMRDDFDENIRLGILDITDPTAAAIARLDAEFEMLRRDARALGGDLSQVNRLYRLQREQILENNQTQMEALRAEQQVLQQISGTVDSLTQWMNAQAVSADSSLSPNERLAEAQRQFGSALSDVRGGDLSATGTLTSAADTLLSLGRDQFASSVDFAALESQVRRQLESVQTTITSDRFIGDQVEKAIRQSGQDTVNELQQLRREVKLLRQDVRRAA